MVETYTGMMWSVMPTTPPQANEDGVLPSVIALAGLAADEF